MKITKIVIKQFEIEQKEWGTKVALSNFIINITSHLLKNIGVEGIKMKYRKL